MNSSIDSLFLTQTSRMFYKSTAATEKNDLNTCSDELSSPLAGALNCFEVLEQVPIPPIVMTSTGVQFHACIGV